MSARRHFVKEDLPRIRYANPAIDIQVTKLLKTKEETWKPEMVVELSAFLLLASFLRPRADR